MKQQAQRDINPFRYSDTNKRYHTYDYYMRHAFGGKCVKIPLDAGFTCPNIDGTCGRGGCIYCSGRGSGDFAAPATLPIAEQYRVMRAQMAKKWSVERCIPYFQARTNTYAAPARLRALWEEALMLPGAVGLNIATRADCLPKPVLYELARISEKTVLTVELGLQTVHDQTATRINRGHSFAQFEEGYRRLRERVPHARVSFHTILGLIGESDEMMVKTAQNIARLQPDEVKLHLLYVLEGTEMAQIYRNGGYMPLDLERYVRLVVHTLELLPPEVVVGRLTGDGPRNTLLAPRWSQNKIQILNEIDKKFYETNSYQGKNCLLRAIEDS